MRTDGVFQCWGNYAALGEPVGAGASSTSAELVPVQPERLLDTRPDLGQIGYSGPKPVAGQTLHLKVTQVGMTQIPIDAAAVVLNVTGTEATAGGFVTVWPCGQPRPDASSLNLDAGGTRANLVISRVGATGEVCLLTNAGVHLVADVAAWLPPGTPYHAVQPERLLETRSAFGQRGYQGPKPTAGQILAVQVTGVGATQVPGDASAVVLNVTGTEATAGGFLTVWPCGEPRPNTSNLNLDAGETAPNLVVSKVGVNGQVCAFTNAGTHLVADVVGWFAPTSSYRPLEPERLLETRVAFGQQGYSGPKPVAGQTVQLKVVGVGAAQVPGDASAVVLNVTGTDATAGGFVTVWPCGEPRPNASSLNLEQGSTRPNVVITKVGAGGKVCIYTDAGTHLLADIAGYFPAA